MSEEIEPMAIRYESCPHCEKRIKIEVYEDRDVSIEEVDEVE